MCCRSPYRSTFYFLLQAPPVNHVKCHRLIDRLCFVFLLCHEKISCLHPCHFNLKIFMSWNHRGKGEPVHRARGQSAGSCTYHCCTVAAAYKTHQQFVPGEYKGNQGFRTLQPSVYTWYQQIRGQKNSHFLH